MDITVSHKQGFVPVTVFHIKGDVDMSTSEQLQMQARQALESGTRNLLLDLAEVPYVSYAGIRAMNNIFNLLRANAPDESEEAISQGLRDGTFKSLHLKLLNPNPQVAQVLTMAGVDMFLEMRCDLQTAVASFN